MQHQYPTRIKNENWWLVINEKTVDEKNIFLSFLSLVFRLLVLGLSQFYDTNVSPNRQVKRKVIFHLKEKRNKSSFPSSYPAAAPLCGLRRWYSTSSTVQTAPLTFSTRIKHLWRDKLWRTAFCSTFVEHFQRWYFKRQWIWYVNFLYFYSIIKRANIFRKIKDNIWLQSISYWYNKNDLVNHNCWF